MINVVKKIEFDDELKKKIEFICGFYNNTLTIINGNIRKIDRTNLSYIVPHRIIIKGITFLGVWEELNNENFKVVEFNHFKNEARRHAFTMSPQKWIRETNAIGIISKSGKYGGGTFARSNIAFDFASWISPEFKLNLIKEFERLKRN